MFVQHNGSILDIEIEKTNKKVCGFCQYHPVITNKCKYFKVPLEKSETINFYNRCNECLDAEKLYKKIRKDIK